MIRKLLQKPPLIIIVNPCGWNLPGAIGKPPESNMSGHSSIGRHPAINTFLQIRVVGAYTYYCLTSEGNSESPNKWKITTKEFGC